MINDTVLLWSGFTLFIFAMLALDLGVFQRKAHVISMREALAWFGFWTGLAMVFNIGIILFHDRGAEAGLEFFTGFLVEKSLSVDNIFVFLLIFGFFKVPQTYQHKVLFWGIVGAIVLRIAFILGGLALLERFHWMIYVFGSFLLLTGISMLRKKDTDPDPSNNWVVRTFKKFYPVSDRYDGNKFFTRLKDGTRAATPLFIVLLAVESSDIIFAVDSIPAIFAITEDPFIVYTSNIFAMLGLRALYFAVAGFMRMFHFLHYGFASIILILGVKMLLADVYKVPVALSLVLIMVILLVCVIVSLMRPRADDLKMMFERPERLGLLPFRRLLLIENIVDMGDVTVRDAMRFRRNVRCLQSNYSWDENMKLMRESRYSRYPIIKDKESKPHSVLHVKDLILTEPGFPLDTATLEKLSRPVIELNDDLPLDEAMALFQRHFDHLGVVLDKDGNWIGIITFEDVLEELVGKIGDEFDTARGESVSLPDSLSPERVVFHVEGESLKDAIQHILHHVPESALPAEREVIIDAVLKRETTMPTYLGRGMAIPHCRLPGLEAPIVFFGRSEEGIPLETSNDRAELIFILLTPDHMARMQPRLLADIAGLVESEYVMDRFKKAEKPEEVVEAMRAGQLVVLG